MYMYVCAWDGRGRDKKKTVGVYAISGSFFDCRFRSFRRRVFYFRLRTLIRTESVRSAIFAGRRSRLVGYIHRLNRRHIRFSSNRVWLFSPFRYDFEFPIARDFRFVVFTQSVQWTVTV